MKKRVAIVCSACGEDTLIRREPVYEEFKKTGERLTCTACGHEYASEEDVPYKDSTPRIFSAADKSAVLDLFTDDEKGHNCRHCRHYVIHPFTQRCGLHQKEVKATDVCDDFEAQSE